MPLNAVEKSKIAEDTNLYEDVFQSSPDILSAWIAGTDDVILDPVIQSEILKAIWRRRKEIDAHTQRINTLETLLKGLQSL
jgi:hypothetical protein